MDRAKRATEPRKKPERALGQPPMKVSTRHQGAPESFEQGAEKAERRPLSKRERQR